MRVLCNINVWRRKSGNSMEGFYSHLSCISRIFRPECSFGKRKTTNPCIQVPDFPPRLPGAQGSRNGFCRFVKKYDNKTKHGYHPLQHESAILYGMDLYPCFCAAFLQKKSAPQGADFFIYDL